MYEPSCLEIFLTKLIGNTLLFPYYRGFVNSLKISPTDSILDVCSGSGILSKHTAKKLTHGHLTCMDVSKRWLGEAERQLEKFNVGFEYIETLSSRPLAGCPFDMAYIHFTLHEFKKPERLMLLNFIVQNLKPEGILIIREPSNKHHGIKLFEIINILESMNLKSYTYSIRNYPLIGKTLDFRISV